MKLKSKQAFNRIVYKFWLKIHTVIDFDVQIKENGSWKTIIEVRDNSQKEPVVVFPAVEAREIRTIFLKVLGDNTVRLAEMDVYNWPVAVKTLSEAPVKSGLLQSATPQIKLKNVGTEEAKLNVSVQLNFTGRGDSFEAVSHKQYPMTVASGGEATVSLPVPAESKYGFYNYDINITTESGVAVEQLHYEFCQLPENPSRYLASSPFGVHCDDISEYGFKRLGISWWRTHDHFDCYWNYIENNQGKQNWSNVDKLLDMAKQNRAAMCITLEGAPARYSTLIPNDPEWWNSEGFYPPADINAFVRQYALPFVEKSKTALAYRAYELWNESWSYYRWRGMKGTPAELMVFLIKNYQAIKKDDPHSIVLPTDVRLSGSRNEKFSYPAIGRDMLELGFLRFADVTPYHAYMMARPKEIETIRRKTWNFGRDLALWNTESSVQPADVMAESFARLRAYGVDKAFLFNMIKYAAFVDKADRVTMNLPTYAALIRNLGDALYLGSANFSGQRLYFFANGKNAVTMAFTNKKWQQETLPLTISSRVTDVFGNPVDFKAESVASPIFISSPSEQAILSAVASEVRKRSKLMGTQSLVTSFAKFNAPAGIAELDAKFAEISSVLSAARATSENGDFLYDSNYVLNLINNYQIWRARCQGKNSEVPSQQNIDKRIKTLWAAAHNKTNWSACLLNTSRMASRAQKQAQWAKAYAVDGDRIAANVLLARADASLRVAEKWLQTEQPAHIYRPKLYFRTKKLLLRSSEYHFAAGKAQKVYIAIANPLGKSLTGSITIDLPEGWQVNKTELPYSVAPLRRQIIEAEITAPAEFQAEDIHFIKLSDTAKHLAPVSVLCHIAETVADGPVLQGLMSQGMFPGN